MIMIKRKPRKAFAIQTDAVVSPAEALPGKRPQHKCRRCGYSWTGKGRVRVPKECPDCKSRNWR